MFIGHYAAAYVLYCKHKEVSLVLLFKASQFVDILFFPFALFGLESLEFVPEFTQTNDFKMDFPYSHSLVGSIIWSILFGAFYFLIAKKKSTNGKRVALVLGIGVFSHWIGDLLVHTPDLPLLYGDPKFGFGLWHNKLATVGLETIVLLLGLWYYIKQTKPNNNLGNYMAIAFSIFLLLINYLNYYVLPPNHDLLSLTVSALVTYFVLAGLASWVDKKRS